MGYHSRIPQIVTTANLMTQRAVDQTGQHVEFLALQRAARRRLTGMEMRGIKWSVNKRNPHMGRVRANFVTRFHEWGTVYMHESPILGPAADEAFPGFVDDIGQAWR